MAGLPSFVAIKPKSDFPLDNLPFGIFSRKSEIGKRHAGVAIGGHIVDLAELTKDFNLLRLQDPSIQEVFQSDSLNNFLVLGRACWTEVRHNLQRLLSVHEGALRDDKRAQERILVPMEDAVMHLPVAVGDFTDFSASKRHAENDKIMFTNNNNVLPNWHYIPVAYHSRASSIVLSGTGIRRPKGQFRTDSDSRVVFHSSEKVDFEAELGAIIGVGNDLGFPVHVDEAEKHVFGMVLLNDWSARDMQAWEWAPLGPFLSKSYATTISPWIVTMDALEPFRIDTDFVQNPKPLEYLRQSRPSTFDVNIDVSIQTTESNGAEFPLSTTNYKHMYWTLAQQIAHHTSNGCNLRPGDLIGSGTISGPTHESSASLSELSVRGTQPVKLSNGQSRSFIEDYDTVTIRGFCEKDGVRIGFGNCTGTILPALT